jgi:general secretion pathway protein G
MRKATLNNGFTLIELIVTATITAILMTIGIVSYRSANEQSRDTKRKSDIEQIRASLEMYKADNGYYPAVLDDLLTNNYIQAVPKDPQDPVKKYNYVPTGVVPNIFTYNLMAKVENISGGSYALESSCPLVNSYTYCVSNP